MTGFAAGKGAVMAGAEGPLPAKLGREAFALTEATNRAHGVTWCEDCQAHHVYARPDLFVHTGPEVKQ